MGFGALFDQLVLLKFINNDLLILLCVNTVKILIILYVNKLKRIYNLCNINLKKKTVLNEIFIINKKYKT